MTFDFSGWVRQPSTILGIGSIGALIAGALAQYAGGGVSAIVTVGTVVFGVVHLALPDNTAAAAAAQALAMDVVKGVATHTMTVQIPALLNDLTRLVTAIAPPRFVAADPVPVVAAIPAPLGDMSQSGSHWAEPLKPAAATLGLAMLLAVCVTLSACAPAEQAQLQVACEKDQVIVPIAGGVLGALVPEAAGAVAIDQALVHPQVLAFCAALGGKPAAIVPTTPAAAH